MATFRFHLVGPSQPVELDVAANSISELNEIVSRQRFVEGRLTEPDGDGVLLGMLIATARIQCVVEAG
ncbi:MAG: hypothetical protein JWM75_2484 [Sphingomonas bacterium]|nr:hypothetical protein [Sphingomonas bacterium]